MIFPLFLSLFWVVAAWSCPFAQGRLITPSTGAGEEVKEASIRSIGSFNEIAAELRDLPPGTLVIFDVDDTLFTSCDALFHPCGEQLRNAHYAEIAAASGRAEVQRLASLCLLQRQAVLVEPGIPECVRGLQEREDLKVIALTAMVPGPFGMIASMEAWRLEELARFGFDFSSAHSEEVAWERCDFPHPVVFKGGVCASGKVPKGVALVTLLKELEWHPSMVVFIDDRHDYVASVAQALTEEGIGFRCFHYRAVEQRKVVLDVAVAEMQLKILREQGRWVSEAEARTYTVS